MKRTCWLICALAMLVTVTVISIASGESSIVVDTVTLTTKSVDKTISCDGVLEAGDTIAIFPNVSCIIDEVIVQEGMYVEQGEVIARINKQATKAYGQISQYEALSLSAMSEEITATVSGIVLKIDMGDGDYVERSQACAVIAPIDSIRVRIAIREKNLPLLHRGMAASISGDGLSNGHYSGTLTEILSTAQSVGGGTVVEGVVELDDTHDDESLRIGINVNAKIILETISDGIIIPYEAVTETEDRRNNVYILSDGVPIAYEIDVSDELSHGVLVSDQRLRGEKVIMYPDTVVVDTAAKYVSAEDLG